MHPRKFRHNAAITIAGVVAFFGTVPFATTRWYLLPLLVVPLAVAVWAWRAGTDAGPDGVRVRALFGSRLIRWPEIAGMVRHPDGRVYLMLSAGGRVRLPAVNTDPATLTPAEPNDATTPQ